MATQFADIAPRPAPTAPPRNPNIRVAFVAGPAVQAVSDELAKLPDATRTLDEMVRPSQVERFVQLTSGLSGAMRHSFLRWLDVCLKFEALPADDDDALAIGSDQRDEAIRALMQTPALTDDDLLVKAHIWTIDAGPASVTSFGPIGDDANVGGFRADTTPVHIGRDLLRRSPLSVLLNEMAKSPPADLPIDLCAALNGLGDDPWTAQYREAVTAVEAMKAYQRNELNPVYRLSDEMEASGLDHNALYKIVTQRESRSGDLVSAAARAIDGLFLVPMASLDALRLAIDLAKYAEIELCDDEARLLAGVAGSVDRIIGDGDTAITTAFSSFSRHFADHYTMDMSKDMEKAYFKRSDELQAVMFDNKAMTLSGVVAKLRLVFKDTVGKDWSDYAILDTSEPIFVKGLEQADVYERLLWSSIEDLARIAGVDLKEQGA